MKRPREWHGEASGRTHTKEYHAWAAMKDRCHNPKCSSYKDYGARGITVCDRWRNSYVAFLEDVGRSQENETLDRIDNNKGYYKENCRWVVRTVQQRNTRESIYVVYNGVKMHLNEACKLSGIKPGTVHARKFHGWPEEDWFKPLSNKGSHGNHWTKEKIMKLFE